MDPLEQIRELCESVIRYGRSDGATDCAKDVLAILAASEGWVCVPKWRVEKYDELVVAA